MRTLGVIVVLCETGSELCNCKLDSFEEGIKKNGNATDLGIILILLITTCKQLTFLALLIASLLNCSYSTYLIQSYKTPVRYQTEYFCTFLDNI